MLTLDPRSAALVLIDLQQGIVDRPLAPRSGGDVLSAGRALAERFRAAGAPVVLVRVTFADDYADAPPSNVDSPMQRPPGGMPEAWSRLADGLAAPGDIVVVKRQWGAFHGTDLDLQLRRRGIRNVVVGGIATNFGVESTVRAAWEHGYDVVVPEDVCATMSAEMHEFAFQHIFPRIARVTKSADIAFA
jgi:nicotinamidase-related amidase